MQAKVTPIGAQPQLQRLRVTEIFASIQGESRTVGVPTIFIRLTGCPLRCQYCDTAYAFTGGNWMNLEGLEAKVASFNLKHVTVTGGEPLAQKTCLSLLSNLCDQNYCVSLETSGALDVSQVDPRVIKVMDIKTPASNEAEKNLWENVNYLREQDQVKFVICNQADYIWSKNIIEEYQLTHRCEVLLSPSYEQLEPRQLAEWILKDQLNVRFQLQLHKILWGDKPGH
ncbi:MAG: 7-carboxy-7-deazaguanine synthase QueE [Gammaproteobacteria bacterium]|nr:7-carboxy-7-deazaguanine synthase QueE [Gammaproteobacteria bacterium]